MAEIGAIWRGLRSVILISLSFVAASVLVSAERNLVRESTRNGTDGGETGYLMEFVNFLWQPNQSSYQHVWPVSI